MSFSNQAGGVPVLVLKEGSNRSRGKDAQHFNITAAKVVAESIRSALGPRGMDKMLADNFGDVTITSDGRTILDEMDVQNPAAKMLVEVAKAQDNEAGDGTTSAVIIAGELLTKGEELLNKNVHPIVIIEGYKLSQEKDDKQDNFQRILAVIEFINEERKFVLAVSHFSLSSKVQVKNTWQCLQHLAEFNKENLPAVICADLNSAPLEEPSKIIKNAGFLDVWEELKMEEFASWPVNVDLVKDNEVLKRGVPPKWEIVPRRIDYIFVKDLKAESIEKIGLKEDNIWHSDHWGLIAQIKK